MKSMKHLDLQMRLTFYADKNPNEGTFGKGIATLLRGVADWGSLNMAAKKIHMAYSKAWRIMKEAEASFGFNLINRDGARGSTLTEEGKKLLRTYEQLEEDGSAFLEENFRALLKAK